MTGVQGRGVAGESWETGERGVEKGGEEKMGREGIGPLYPAPFHIFPNESELRKGAIQAAHPYCIIYRA